MTIRAETPWTPPLAGNRFQAAWAQLSPLKPVLYAFAASRLALLLVGLMTQIFFEPVSGQVSALHMADHAALRMWGQWDTGWYYSIAAEGYSSHATPNGQVNWVFFPAFPLLSAAIAKITHLPVFVAMLLLSNVSFLSALLLVHRLALEEFGRRTAALTVALICAVPGSYIYSSAYTESLFLLAIAGCLLMLRRERWLAAGAFAALATLTRNLGIGLVLPFAFALATRMWALRREAASGDVAARGRLSGEAMRAAAGLAMPIVALAAFCLLLYQASGDPFAFVTAQHAWNRSIGNPLRRLLDPIIVGGLNDSDLINFAAAWLSMGMVAALAVMGRWRLFILAAFLTLTPLSTGLPSYARYCLVVAPLFMAGAKLLAPRPAAAMSVIILFATLNGLMMAAWTLGMWVTV